MFKQQAVQQVYVESTVRSALDSSKEFSVKVDAGLWQAAEQLEEAAVRAVKTSSIVSFQTMRDAVKTCEAFSRAASKLQRAHFEACEAIEQLGNISNDR
jgi:hypothetical protein